MSQKYSKKFMGIAVGDTFDSFEEVKERITYVQEVSQVPLLLRDYITLKGAARRRPHVAELAKPDLVYHSVRYSCICARNDPQRTRTYIRLGISPEYLSKKGERCEAEIRFELTADCRHLEVKKINHIHNHKISQKLYKIMALSKIAPDADDSSQTKAYNYRKRKQLLTETRSLYEKSQRGELADLAPVARKRTRIVYDVKTEFDDDHEFEPSEMLKPPIAPIEASTNKKGNHGRRIAFKHLVEEMYLIQDAICEVYEEGMRPYAVFFQTEDMKRNFSFYPEVLLIDTNCKLSSVGMKLLILMITDGNGECVIVGLCFVTQLNFQVISFLFNTFLKCNPKCYLTQSVVLDQYLAGAYCNDIMSHFPLASSFMSYHHAMTSYREAILTNKDLYFENEEERDLCIGIFRKMAFAEDYDTYYRQFQRFKLYAPAILHNYFVINWHRKLELWVDCMKPPQSSFLNQRWGRLVKICSIFTSVCCNFKSIPQFFDDVMKTITRMQLERKQRALLVPIKGPVVTTSIRIAESRYRNYLTSHAYCIVRKQMQSSASVKIIGSSGNGFFIASPKYGKILSTPTSCPCKVFTTTGLPCSHVFAVRGRKGLQAYDNSLCHERWSIQYLRESLQLNVGDSDLVADSSIACEEAYPYEDKTSSLVEPMEESRSIPPLLSSPPKCEGGNVMIGTVFGDQGRSDSGLRDANVLLNENDKTPEDAEPVIDWVDMLETL